MVALPLVLSLQPLNLVPASTTALLAASQSFAFMDKQLSSLEHLCRDLARTLHLRV
jgi:hypothetical protein